MKVLRSRIFRILFCLILGGGGFPPEGYAEVLPDIDRIDLLGVSVFQSQMIEGALEVSAGYPLERQKVLKTEENLQSLYFLHGYENVRINSRLMRKKGEKGVETVLEFDVSEGKPVRVTDIQVELKGSRSSSSAQSLGLLVEKIKADIGIVPGDVFNQEKINDAKRTIQETLASDEYVGAKVESVYSVEDSASTALTGKFKDAARWVKVNLTVDLGDKVIFGYRGNTVFTRGYLDNLVDEQRLIGLGKDYIGAVKARLEEEYHSLGYAQVQIQPITTEPAKPGAGRRVSFFIKEGPRIKIESLQFEGNFVFTKKELKKVFYSKASVWVQRDIYVEKDVQNAAELLIEWMKERGYLSARLITINSQLQKNAEKILLYIYEGEQTIVSNLVVHGTSALSKDELQDLLAIKPGFPLNLFTLSEGIERIKSAFRDRGYLNFQLLNDENTPLVLYSEENRRAEIALRIDEGPQFHVAHIDIEGLSYTKEFVVRRELTFREGEILGESQLIQNERKLRRLGIFSTVGVRLLDDPKREDYKIVKINLGEADRGVLVWGPGFRNDLGIRLFGQLAYSNLWGLNHTVSVNANINRRIFYNYKFTEGQFQISYLWPWFALPEMSFRPTFSIGRTQYINFSADTLTLSTAWDKPILTKPNLVAGLTYTLERIQQFRALDSANDGQLLIGTVTPKLTLDLRDNPLVPTRGLFSLAWLDVALGSQTNAFKLDADYYRVQFRADYYVPVSSSVVWSASFRSGYEQRLSISSSIPLIKQFALGGIGSLRGYQEQEFNAQKLYSDQDTIQKMTYVNYRTQLDLPFAGALRFGVFVDAANLLLDRYSFTDNLFYTAGFGFHYQTPVGPVNLDIGFKLFQPPFPTDRSLVHFSVGII